VAPLFSTKPVTAQSLVAFQAQIPAPPVESHPPFPPLPTQPLFQSASLEVQERASTFRHLLAELDILSMTWEAMAEEVAAPDVPSASAAAVMAGKKGKGAKKAEKKAVSLLDDMVEDLLELPEYTALSVQAVDDQGSKAAKRHARVLAAATGEAFYAVHAKVDITSLALVCLLQPALSLAVLDRLSLPAFPLPLCIFLSTVPPIKPHPHPHPHPRPPFRCASSRRNAVCPSRRASACPSPSTRPPLTNCSPSR